MQRARVAAAAAGNPALGPASHGAQLGRRVTVVMPATAPAVNLTRCRGLGAEVALHGETFEPAPTHARQIAAATLRRRAVRRTNFRRCFGRRCGAISLWSA